MNFLVSTETGLLHQVSAQHELFGRMKTEPMDKTKGPKRKTRLGSAEGGESDADSEE